MGNAQSSSSSTDVGMIAGIVVAVFVGLTLMILIGYGAFTGLLSSDAAMAIFITVVGLTSIGLSSSIGTMSGAPQQNAKISLMGINSLSILILGVYLWYKSYFNIKTNSVQESQQFILLVIPVAVIMSIVSLSATAMKQLTTKHCKK